MEGNVIAKRQTKPIPSFHRVTRLDVQSIGKELHKILWMIWGKIGWANKYLGDDIWLDKHIQDIYNKQISGDTPGEMWMT